MTVNVNGGQGRARGQLRTDAAAAYDALKADPSEAILAENVRAGFEAKWAARP